MKIIIPYYKLVLLYCTRGILLIHIDYDLNQINKIVSDYLLGKDVDKKILNRFIRGDNSLLWNRDLSQDSHSEVIE